MSNWTNLGKPTGSSYTKINSFRPSYDESSITYDSSADYYDGINQGAYTNLAKPTGGFLLLKGYATGVLGPPTYSVEQDASPWVDISKPI